MTPPDVPRHGDRDQARARCARRGTSARSGRGGVRAARADDVALPSTSELSLTQSQRGGRSLAGARRVVGLALDAREGTGGRFDPTVHDALVAAGYDRTFEELRRGPSRPARPRAAAASRSPASIGARPRHPARPRRDRQGLRRRARRRAARGRRPVSRQRRRRRRRSRRAGGREWAVAVGEPADGRLTRGGLATSGRDRRHWRRDGVQQHHLIDPATGRPADSDLVRVTAVGGRRSRGGGAREVALVRDGGGG